MKQTLNSFLDEETEINILNITQARKPQFNSRVLFLFLLPYSGTSAALLRVLHTVGGQQTFV